MGSRDSDPVMVAIPLDHFMIRRTPLLAGLIALAACGPKVDDPVYLTAHFTEEGAERVLTLSRTLGEIALAAEATILTPDLILGGGDDGFGYVVDVAAVEDKVFVLDALAHEIRGFDGAGTEIVRFGRSGQGPGEFRSPIAIAAMDSLVITWQYPSAQAFAVWDHTGALRSAAGAEIDGDWNSGQWKKPRFMGPVDVGPEDLPQRLRSTGPDEFIHLIQPDDGPFRRNGKPYPYEAPPAYLVRYDLNLEVVDTVAVLAGAGLEVIEETVPIPNSDRIERIHFAHERLYSGRPVWATGENWIAVSHGDSAVAAIRGLDGQHWLDIRWPPRRTMVQATDMREAAKWMLAYQVVHATSSREMFASFSRGEIEEGVRVTAFEWTRFAQRAPTITAAFGAGECVFIAGFSPESNRYGVSLTWLAINVVRGSLEGVFRFEPTAAMRFGRHGIIDRHGGAVRAFTANHAYLVTVDGDGESFVERFRIPPGYYCAPEAGAA